MIATEYQLTGRERPEVLLLMERNLEVMKASVELGLGENLVKWLNGWRRGARSISKSSEALSKLYHPIVAARNAHGGQ